MNENQVREFVADSAANLTPYGLKEPFLTLAWNDTSTSRAAPAAAGTGNGFTVEPVIGLNTALHFGIDKDNHLYAKYEDEPFIYRVGASVLNAVPRDSARWKALNPVRFTQFGLRNITLSMGTNPPVSLDYNPVTAEWKGTRAGQDLTPYIDRVKADRMSGKLATLVVDDWVQDRSAAVKALQTPSITVAITVDVEPGNPKSATRVITLNFAPTVPAPDAAMFYGRLDNEPDIFTINRISLHEAIRSVMKD